MSYLLGESTLMWVLILGFGFYSIYKWLGIEAEVEKSPKKSLNVNDSQVSYDQADPDVLLEMIKQFRPRLILVIALGTLQFIISLMQLLLTRDRFIE